MKDYALFFIISLALLVHACRPCDDPTDPECPNYCQDHLNPDCPNYCPDPGDPDCPHYDPCFGKQPVSAGFQMQEVPAFQLPDDSGFEPYDTDTAIFRQIRFIADEPNADMYEWEIGAGTYNTRAITLSLSGMEDLIPFDIPARLIVHKTPDTSCFPNDDGIDTLERSLHIVEVCEPLWEGTYQGYVEGESPTDTFTVSIENDNPVGFDPEYCAEGIRLVNWDRQGCIGVIDVYYCLYRYGSGSGSSCNSWKGYVWVNPTGDTIQAHYRQYTGRRDSNNQRIFEEKVFNGVRVK
jgi:hypothetical protein